jgi:hypothetical protein
MVSASRAQHHVVSVVGDNLWNPAVLPITRIGCRNPKIMIGRATVPTVKARKYTEHVHIARDKMDPSPMKRLQPAWRSITNRPIPAFLYRPFRFLVLEHVLNSPSLPEKGLLFVRTKPSMGLSITEPRRCKIEVCVPGRFISIRRLFLSKD